MINTQFALANIRINGGTQPRAAINTDAVTEYADSIKSGAKMPPLILFFDGTDYWLADGFHRYHAFRLLELLTAEVDIRNGTLRDAILYSVGANETHGLRRTDADKRKAVETLLKDASWSTLTHVKIAQHCKVSESYVGKVWSVIKGDPSSPRSDDSKREVTRGGTTYLQDVRNNGKKVEPAKAPPQAPPPSPPQASPKATEPPAQPKTGTTSPPDVKKPKYDIASMTDADIEALLDENEKLKADLKDITARRDEAVRLCGEYKVDNEEMASVWESDDKVKQALTEATKWRDIAKGYRTRIDGLVSEKSDAVKIAGGLKRAVDKLEKEIAKLKGEQ